MRAYVLLHLSDSTLLHELASLVREDRVTTAALLAHIAEFDARRLYLPAGYPSTFAYCAGELRLSEDAAFKRIRAARAAREFPLLFVALAQGELHLAAITRLAPHLTHSNVRELVEVSKHKKSAEVEELLARRFPRPDLPEMLAADAGVSSETTATLHQDSQLAPGRVGMCKPLPEGTLEFGSGALLSSSPISGHVLQLDDASLAGAGASAEPIGAHACAVARERHPKTTPLSADRYALQLTMSRATHDKLRHAQELLSHRVRPGDLAGLLDCALDALIARLEHERFAATSKPRRSARRTIKPHSIPAAVKRAVWQRDQGQCTFVAGNGHRCGSRTRLEFDHVEPVARGGRSTVGGLRLRCRAHNQYEAERIFGTDYMASKRAHARQRATESAARRFDISHPADAPAHDATALMDADLSLALRRLGYRPDESRSAIAHVETLRVTTLEHRLRAALRHLAPTTRSTRSESASSTPALASSALAPHATNDGRISSSARPLRVAHG